MMDWNKLYKQIGDIKSEALTNIKTLLTKVKDSPNFDEESGYFSIQESEMLVDGEMQYVTGVKPDGTIRVSGYESDIYALDVYDLVYLGEQIDLVLNGKWEG